MTSPSQNARSDKALVSLAGLGLTPLMPVNPTAPLDLGDAAARVPGVASKKELEVALAQRLDRLQSLQDALFADGRHAVLLVLQGRDASGKDGVIKTVCGAFNPTGVRVMAFGPPTPLELRHDFLWRVHQAVPPRGQVGVFNRSHYEDVLAVRVRRLAPESVWRGRYAHINAFEELLHDNGVVILKCFLHVSQDEQHERLTERLDDPHKNWKFRAEDIEDRARWAEYTEAYHDALTRCSMAAAPWYVVPSDSKTVRNLLIADVLMRAMDALPLRYPTMPDDVREAARDFR
jgi:PPK2 family polyphosphate:nucleotide phosphotransferase